MRITTAGVVSDYTDPAISDPASITAGPDGALWFTNGTSIGRITIAGVLAGYAGSSADPIICCPGAITPGPDGALWFADVAQIGRITNAGVVTSYFDPAFSPGGITTGPDGALWFTHNYDSIGRLTAGGVFSDYSVPNRSGPRAITAGPDGALWFTNISNNSIGRITTAGVVANYAAGSKIPLPVEITAGPDGALWFSFSGGTGRISDLPAPQLSLNPAAGPPSKPVRLMGSGFGAFEWVKISFVDSVNGTTAVGAVKTDARGDFGQTVKIPDGATPGRQTITVRGAISRVTGTQVFTVT